MNTLTPTMQNAGAFFDVYTRALETYDTKAMAYLYNLPCTMISDEATTLFNDAGKLEGFFNQGAAFYRQFGIAHVRYEIWNRRMLTDKIMNVKVNWQYLDVFKNPIYNCDYFYVLKSDKSGKLKIILSVSINEKERMEAWKLGAGTKR